MCGARVHSIAFIEQRKEASDALYDDRRGHAGFCAGDVLAGDSLDAAGLEIACIAGL
jgi:hypothetical protein